jgi:deoxyribose-phosphate aldolase
MKLDVVRSQVSQALEHAGITPAGPSGKSYRAVAGQDFARYFDHTLLKPEATESQFNSLFDEAKEHGVASVCVPPNRVVAAVNTLAGSGVAVCTVVGFPLGYEPTASKKRSVEVGLAEGCTEFDMVLPIGLLKDGNYAAVYSDIRGVVEASEGNVVKVIIETGLLTDDEKAAASMLTVMAGASMIKTSTGFAEGGAALADLRLMREIAGDRVGVKAAGGIRDRVFAKKCIEAGADRLGASRTVQILTQDS